MGFVTLDAIESGIVKLPRVPVAENIAGDEMPMFRDGNDAGVQIGLPSARRAGAYRTVDS